MRATTILLIFLLVTLVIGLQAQDTGRFKVQADSCIGTMSGTMPYFQTGVTTAHSFTKIDTIDCILLVSEIKPSFENKIAYTIKGFEVLKQNGFDVEWFYLDENKKRMSKNLYVWMTKRLSK